ncbi:MAG: NADH-quinone oxidoreductase subunit J [Actinomycetota bacterium]|jgi:NADH-quinone oxidoreductase subunit J|nr:NADH-quinone oxidoreductase subunit J [Actinomycetota bacterium]
MTGAATLLAAETSTGEAIVFWVLAPLAVLAALGVVLTRKAVHSALLLAFTMICLAIFYITQDAPFLGVVQVVVYTGAIMMLFLFVLMLVGVDASDSLVETLRGQRVLGALAAIGFVVLLVFSLGQALTGDFVGLDRANANGNVEGVAGLLFDRYVLAFEVTGALLITAALGAMVLTHRERFEHRPTQRERAEQRFRSGYPAPLPGPGVYARHNAVDTLALLPDGTPAELSVSPKLRGPGMVRPTEPALPPGPRPGEPEPDYTSSQLGKGPVA